MDLYSQFISFLVQLSGIELHTQEEKFCYCEIGFREKRNTRRYKTQFHICESIYIFNRIIIKAQLIALSRTLIYI